MKSLVIRYLPRLSSLRFAIFEFRPKLRAYFIQLTYYGY